MQNAVKSGAERMRFRLTYDGELKSSQRDPLSGQVDKMAEHKQAIRKVFHQQLKQLWETNKFLREHRVHPKTVDLSPAEQAQQAGTRIPMAESIARSHREYGYRFVPLVRRELSLLCALDILFLRRDYPGSVFSAGDLDNRIKTLIDTLRRPHGQNELRGNETPAIDEDPFFCLLENDDLVTELTVRTDNLLYPPTGSTDKDRRQVKLVITVEIKPYDVTMFNLSFA
jgi:hypothetical protein